MRSYVTRAWLPGNRPSDEVDLLDEQPPRTLVVYERDCDTTHTGLVDRHGVPIYRVADRVAMGFQKRS